MTRDPIRPTKAAARGLEAEPLRSNRSLVRAHQGRAVPFELRLQILRALADDGPLALDSLLRSLVCETDPAAAVLSLCCEGLLELDLESGPIGPSTLVRSRT